MLTILLWLPIIVYMAPIAYIIAADVAKAVFAGEFVGKLFAPVPEDKLADIIANQFASISTIMASMVFLYALLPIMMSDRKTKAEKRAFAFPLAILTLPCIWSAFYTLCKMGAYAGAYGITVARAGALAGCAMLVMSVIWLFSIYANTKNSMFKIMLSAVFTTLCYWMYGVILKYGITGASAGYAGIAIFAAWLLTALDIQFEGLGYKLVCKFLRFGNK